MSEVGKPLFRASLAQDMGPLPRPSWKQPRGSLHMHSSCRGHISGRLTRVPLGGRLRAADTQALGWRSISLGWQSPITSQLWVAWRQMGSSRYPSLGPPHSESTGLLAAGATRCHHSARPLLLARGHLFLQQAGWLLRQSAVPSPGLCWDQGHLACGWEEGPRKSRRKYGLERAARVRMQRIPKAMGRSPGLREPVRASELGANNQDTAGSPAVRM